MKKLIGVACTAIGLMAILGCSGDGGKEATETNKPHEPVTLYVNFSDGYLPGTDFQKLIVEPVKKKYPHLTVDRVKGTIDELLATGTPFDFWVGYNADLGTHLDKNIYTDIVPLAKKHNFDLNRFNQSALDVIRQYSTSGALVALPYAENLSALYYNKDIFDKFGVGYPKDGMTWDDAIDLARKVARVDGGVQYYALQNTPLSFMAQYSLPYIDFKTNKVLVTEEPYKKAYETALKLYQVPNNNLIGTISQMQDKFLKEKTLAMLGPQGNLFSVLKDMPEMKWDIAQRPYHKDKPNISGWFNIHLMVPTKMSKHPDDQMRVLEVLFSDEVQTEMARKTARKSTLTDPKYVEQFGADMPELKGKNIAGMFKGKSGPAPQLSKHVSKAQSLSDAEFAKVAKGEKDINTALRDLEEQIKQYIDSQGK
ncbi:MAG: transporter substrate-binding protein [Paenibacillus sp.]|jgi:multiple sugar transport system substrate-binding protein|nr:transporter substrate-binding protein [Paenibacillus sp.]